MTPSPDFTELRSEEMQELLARPPQWLLRWGITAVFLILLLVAAGAWVIRYPDLVHASFQLTAANAPKAVVTRTEGKIMRLLVQDGQQVPAGAPLAYLESTASHDEVRRLARELAAAWPLARGGNLEGLQRINFAAYHQLGELQSAYQTFEQAHIQLRAYLAGGFYSQKKAVLRQELGDLQLLARQLQQQRVLQGQDARLALDEVEAQRRLAALKVIPALELKREESKNIGRQLTYQQTAATLLNNTSAQRAKQKELLELDKQVAEGRDQFLQALNTLQSAAEAWQAKYVLAAPVGGRVSFAGIVQENQSVPTGRELFYVAPPSAGYVGELRVPQQNAGKVQVGQAVLVRFAGFPYQEFGAVRGRITAIANIPFKDSVFLARVALPTGLKTTYGKSLAYKTGMTASAEGITADNRLLEKLFYQLRSVGASR
ncbi:MAG: HlyD family efflux transporter periplasmic adaptor subunit [Janthinobacterium lividum]